MDRGIGTLECPPRIALELGYPWEQKKGQRHFGPLPNWIGNPPKGSEVFVGKIPRDSDENELIPLFSQAGRIYTMRIMMDFSGYNRGFAFVRFTKKSEAKHAVAMFNGYKIRGERRIGVSLSVDNCRLFIGGIPKTASREEVLSEFRNIVEGIVDIIMYPNPKDQNLNRGFAFLEFDSHQSAAAARRHLIPCPETSFGKLMVDWAEPEPDVDEKIMEKVKILYFRNLSLKTTEADIASLVNCVIKPEKVQRVKKINDYAFVHFGTRLDAEKAMEMLHEYTLHGSVIDVQWSRPVEDKSLYKIKKMINKGAMIDEHMMCAIDNLRVNQDCNGKMCMNDKVFYDTEKTSPKCNYKILDYGRQLIKNDCLMKSQPIVRKISTNNSDDVYATDVTSDKVFVDKNNNMYINNDEYAKVDKHYVKSDVFVHSPERVQKLQYIFDSKYFIANAPYQDYVHVLENMCKYYKWNNPLYELQYQVVNGYYYYTCVLSLGVAHPLYPTQHTSVLHSTYRYLTEVEAKNDAAKNAVDLIDFLCHSCSSGNGAV